MNKKTKLQQLWNYLEVQDDERLIVQSYSHTSSSDVFYVVESVRNQLKITLADSLSDIRLDLPFRLVQQVDSDGRHVIPSVEQLRNDMIADY